MYSATAVPVPGPGSAPVVMGSVAGFVVDVDGNPVSNAVVTLWGDGQIVNPSGGFFGNPQISRLYSLSESPEGPMGFFRFDGVYPGQYTVTAEKDGYNGSVTVSVSNDTVHRLSSPADMQVPHNDTMMANITLNGYHAPVLSAGQLSYAGAVTGIVLDSEGKVLTFGDAKVSLWQNGQMVGRPDNPQYPDLSGDRPRGFLFGHLPPGRYEVRANVTDITWATHRANVTVDVGNSTVIANITLENYFNRYQPVPGSPFTDILFVLLTIFTVAAFYRFKKNLLP